MSSVSFNVADPDTFILYSEKLLIFATTPSIAFAEAEHVAVISFTIIFINNIIFYNNIYNKNYTFLK
jgi:hypothetical protein